MAREAMCKPNRIEARIQANWLNNFALQFVPGDDGYDDQQRMKDSVFGNLEKAVTTVPKGCEMLYVESMTVECRRCRFYINVANL